MMYGRFDATGILKAWSTVPFTVPAADGETDREFPDGATLPGPGHLVRLQGDALVVDESLKPAHLVEREARVANMRSLAGRHKGKKVGNLAAPDQAELLEALAIKAGLADSSGRVV